MNKWLAKDVAAIARSCNMSNHSSLQQDQKISLVRPGDDISTDIINGKKLNVYAEDGQCTERTVLELARLSCI